MKGNKKTEVPRRGRKLRALLLCLCALLILALLSAAALFIIPAFERVSVKTTEGSADWMGQLDGQLPLSEITLPGTHDSATEYVQFAFITKCQALNIREQLEAGIRYLDIRLCFAQTGGLKTRQMKLVHGFTTCRTGFMPWAGTLYLEQVLDQCEAFLKEHPTETILFVVKQDHGDEPVADFETWLDGTLRNRPGLCLLTDKMPTLEEARGKIVLARRYADEAGLGAQSGLPIGWPEQDGHDDVSKNTELVERGGLRLWVQDRFCYSLEDKWNAFLAGLDNSGALPGDLRIHFLSTKGTAAYGHPYHFAKTLNQRLLELPVSRLNGWILLDFADAALCQHIWSANFPDKP